jgi:hypothetical protein
MTDEPDLEAGGLLPCPFCGGAGVVYQDGDGEVNGEAVQCETCGARTIVNVLVPGQGIKQWQARVAPKLTPGSRTLYPGLIE